MALKAPIIPIDTVYKDFRFRSRLEARWAVFLDSLSIAFDYEPEGFNLGAAGYYLPDFYLNDLHLWLEIKPEMPSHEEKQRAQSFAELSGQNIAVLYGRIARPDLIFADSYPYALKDSTYWAWMFYGNFDHLTPGEACVMGLDTLPDWLRDHGVDAPDFDDTIECARLLRQMEFALQRPRPEKEDYLNRSQYGVSADLLLWYHDLAHDHYRIGWSVDNRRWLYGKLGAAYLRAQQARFEHGETP